MGRVLLPSTITRLRRCARLPRLLCTWAQLGSKGLGKSYKAGGRGLGLGYAHNQYPFPRARAVFWTCPGSRLRRSRCAVDKDIAGQVPASPLKQSRAPESTNMHMESRNYGSKACGGESATHGFEHRLPANGPSMVAGEKTLRSRNRSAATPQTLADIGRFRWRHLADSGPIQVTLGPISAEAALADGDSRGTVARGEKWEPVRRRYQHKSSRIDESVGFRRLLRIQRGLAELLRRPDDTSLRARVASKLACCSALDDTDRSTPPWRIEALSPVIDKLIEDSEAERRTRQLDKWRVDMEESEPRQRSWVKRQAAILEASHDSAPAEEVLADPLHPALQVEQIAEKWSGWWNKAHPADRCDCTGEAALEWHRNDLADLLQFVPECGYPSTWKGSPSTSSSTGPRRQGARQAAPTPGPERNCFGCRASGGTSQRRCGAPAWRMAAFRRCGLVAGSRYYLSLMEDGDLSPLPASSGASVPLSWRAEGCKTAFDGWGTSRRANAGLVEESPWRVRISPNASTR